MKSKKKDWWQITQKGFQKVLDGCKTEYEVMIALEKVEQRVRIMSTYRRMDLLNEAQKENT